MLFCCSCINALPCAAQVSIVKHRRVQQLVQCQCSPPHAFPYCRTSNFAKPKGNYTPKERSTSQEKTRSRQGQDQGLLTAPVLDWTGVDWTGLDNCRPKLTASSSTSPHLTSPHILLTTNLRSRVSTIPPRLPSHAPSQLLPSRIRLRRDITTGHVQLRPILLDARPTADKT